MTPKKKDQASNVSSVQDGAGMFLGIASLGALGLILAPVGLLARAWTRAAETVAMKIPKLGLAMGAGCALGQRYVQACQQDQLALAQSLRERFGLSRFDARALNDTHQGFACRGWLAGVADPLSRNAIGQTPLMLAATQWGKPAAPWRIEYSAEDVELLKALAQAAQAQAAVDAADSQGRTAFAELADKVVSLEPLRVLFDAGADPTHLDDEGERAMDGLMRPDGEAMLAEVISWVDERELNASVANLPVSGKKRL